MPRFLRWCDWLDVDPCKASISQVAKFFLYLRQELGFSVPAVRGCWAALNHEFSLTGMDLAASFFVSWMFHSFKRSCPLLEIWPSDWNLSIVLLCLSRPPFETLELMSNKHLTWKMSFLLPLASAKGVSELHGLSFHVRHSCGWRTCTFSFFPDSVAKTQNPIIHNPRFEEFTVPSLNNFVGGD